ncbi:tetratricopeptide-repeat containing protein [Rhodoplanes sp. Z2-YC6860]|nr:tetratricopeptide-repeat containing protein [Rhodoplanes sp. Z2-YC6860]
MNVWCAVARAAFVGATLVWSGLAFGQAFPGSDRELDSLHERILRDPSNVALSVQYARLAKARGDYEAAIGAYERLLLYDPSLSQLKYELGALYFELESYAVARNYFETALGAANLPGDLRDSAKTYITEIDRRLAVDRFTAYLHAGIRYQSNASAGPSSDLIRFGGQSLSVDRAFAKQPDWNSYGLAVFNYAHDFNANDSFEASLGTYYARQFHLERVNLGAAELQAGPRFALPLEQLLGASIKFYGIANALTLGDRTYLTTLGGGVSMRTKPTPTTIIEQAFEYRHRKFYDSGDYPTASQQSGDLATYSLSAGGLVYGTVRWAIRTGFDWSQADFAFWSYRRPFIDLGMPMAFVVPWFGSNRTWILTPYIGGSYAQYDAADPSIDPNTTRRDREWHVGATLDAELATNAGLRLNVNFARNDSNVANYAYRNFSVSLGPAVRF